jgi:hypothetical protein
MMKLYELMRSCAVIAMDHLPRRLKYRLLMLSMHPYRRSQRYLTGNTYEPLMGMEHISVHFGNV